LILVVSQAKESYKKSYPVSKFSLSVCCSSVRCRTSCVTEHIKTQRPICAGTSILWYTGMEVENSIIYYSYFETYYYY